MSLGLALPMPSQRTFALLFLATSLAIFGFVTPWLAGLALGFDSLILLLCAVDGTRAGRTAVSVVRVLPGVLHQGEPTRLLLRLHNPGSRPLHLHLREVLCAQLTDLPVDRRADLPPGGELDLSIDLVPRLRGRARLAPLALRVTGPWGLAWATRDLLSGQEHRVYPRRQLEGAAGLLLRHALERRAGANPAQRRGFGTELYALREYLPGDQLRSIHWKASARQRRPVTREDAWEQHQHVAVLVDCGRPMASLAGDQDKLDHTLAMVLALLRVVVAQHDSATLVLYSKELRRVVRVDPRTRAFAPVFEAVHELQADLDEPDPMCAAAWVLENLPRRSLVLLCTSVIDLNGADQLARALRALARRHRPLLVNLEDPGLLAHAHGQPRDVEAAFAKVSAMGMEQGNHALMTRLRSEGIEAVSASAAQLPLALLRRYLDLKARRRA